jgi:hypothetical protein
LKGFKKFPFSNTIKLIIAFKGSNEMDLVPLKKHSLTRAQFERLSYCKTANVFPRLSFSIARSINLPLKSWLGNLRRKVSRLGWTNGTLIPGNPCQPEFHVLSSYVFT